MEKQLFWIKVRGTVVRVTFCSFCLVGWGPTKNDRPPENVFLPGSPVATGPQRTSVEFGTGRKKIPADGRRIYVFLPVGSGVNNLCLIRLLNCYDDCMYRNKATQLMRNI